MKKAIPLTGSSNGVSDLDLKRFRAALRKQLLKVAQTHPVASTRALFQKMADGNVMPGLTTERKPETVVAPSPTELSGAPPSRRAPPSRQVFRNPNIL